MWVSTTKYFSPSFSYTLLPRSRREVETDVLGGVLGIGEHDRPVVLVDHPAVVGGHVLLELRGVEVAGLLAECLGNLVVDDVHPVLRVDADHRRQRGHRHVGLVPHDVRDDHADLVVHQREATHVGGGVVRLERALGHLERRHSASSFGVSRSSSARMPLNRLLARSRPSSNLGGLESGCDHSGCNVRAALMARGTHVVSHSLSSVLLWWANSLSLVSSENIAFV